MLSQQPRPLGQLVFAARLYHGDKRADDAAIYWLEEDNGTRFLVLELVEGDTLAERLKRGAIPLEESLKLALQIAEALKAALRASLNHANLAPVSRSGRI